MIGRTLAHYEILEKIGSGGMGDVYKARDVRLDRTVAVKILPERFADSAERRERFNREARAISQLNHPHICTLYDVGAEDDVDYLVMEYIEGDTLAERLKKGALPLEKALEYGIQIADGLDNAHRARIVHRDLKPGNVMLTSSGVKLLDFGLAKPIRGDDGAIESEARTEQRDITEEHAVLGTLRYMAPEQLEQKPVDARTDIFALGAVLYEMVTGRKAFEGGSQASLMSAILTSDPPALSETQPLSPPILDRTVRKCLNKDPDERWQSAHDLMDELKWLSERDPDRAAQERVYRTKRLPWLVAAALLVAAVLALLRDPRSEGRTVQSSILPPEGTSSTSSFELSPDGRKLAFVARAENGREMLWVRPLDGLTSQPLAGTEGATTPFWSPGGDHLGFFADGKLKRINAGGGPAQTLTDAPDPRGGTWGSSGEIVFAPTLWSGLHEVSANGGAAEPLTVLDEKRGELSHRWPSFLPDGERLLFLVQTAQAGAENDESRIEVLHLGSRARTPLFQANSSARYARPGYVLYWREGNLLARPFDTSRSELAGDFVPVAEEVGFTVDERAAFTVSSEGTLAYQRDVQAAWSRLAWFDRNGPVLDAINPPESFVGGLAISHDGSKLALVRFDPQSSGKDIWAQDLKRGTMTRLTFGQDDEVSPFWSPDDERLLFLTGPGSRGELRQKHASGLGSEETVLQNDAVIVSLDWSPDGESIVLTVGGVETSADIWLYSLSASELTPLVQSPFDQMYPVYSRDGRWIAYQSNESGRYEVYVQPASGSGGRWQVSRDGGLYPLWNRNGREMFYVAPPNRMMVVPVSSAKTFEAGPPRVLFEANFRFGGQRIYDVTPDGERFVVELQPNVATPITLVTNWTALVERH